MVRKDFMNYIVYDQAGNILSRHNSAQDGRAWIEREIQKWTKYAMNPPYMELHYNGIGYNADQTVTFDTNGKEVLK